MRLCCDRWMSPLLLTVSVGVALRTRAFGIDTSCRGWRFEPPCRFTQPSESVADEECQAQRAASVGADTCLVSISNFTALDGEPPLDSAIVHVLGLISKFNFAATCSASAPWSCHPFGIKASAACYAKGMAHHSTIHSWAQGKYRRCSYLGNRCRYPTTTYPLVPMYMRGKKINQSLSKSIYESPRGLRVIRGKLLKKKLTTSRVLPRALVAAVRGARAAGAKAKVACFELLAAGVFFRVVVLAAGWLCYKYHRRRIE